MSLQVMRRRRLDFTDEQAEDFRQKIISIREETHREIIGLEEGIDALIVALLSGRSGRGHVIFEAAPGRGKTLLVNVIARILDLKFTRLQGTSDYEPLDLVYSQKVKDRAIKDIVFTDGPIFTNILLADELNRTTQKFQAGLLEALEEKKVTTEGQDRLLGPIFHLFATQNPIETEGTYGVSTALMDRFMFKILVSFPAEEELRQIIARDQRPKDLRKLLGPEELIGWSKIIYENFTLGLNENSSVVKYIARILINAYHHQAKAGGEKGESPSLRPGEDMKIAAGVEAFLQGKDRITHEDVKKWAVQILRGRYAISKTKAQGMGFRGDSINDLTDQVIKDVLDKTPLV